MDPPEETIPLCTLKNFPYQIEHTIQWARDYFEGCYADPSAEVTKFYEDPNALLDQLVKQNKQNPTALRAKLETVRDLYFANEKRDYQTCVELGVNIFQDIFFNQISLLLNAFPEDHIIEETGKPFWSGLKRAPIPLKLDFNDPLHLEFVQAAANIFAFMFNIPMNGDNQQVKEFASKIKPKEFVNKKVKIQVDEKEKKDDKPELNEEDEQEVENLLKQLREIKPDASKKTAPVEFEKDDPTNFHIEFILSLIHI